MTFTRPSSEEIQAQKEARKASNLAVLCATSRSIHRGVYAPVDVPVIVPKERPIRSAAYRRLVASMPCCICGILGFSQCAHPNCGKGMGTKTDDRLSFALCGPRLGVAGCHAEFDQGALFTKEERRSHEVMWGRFTRRLITSKGLWPANLPRLETT